MNAEDRRVYVKYRIDTAYKTFEAAKVLAENNYWNSAVNRLYYSVFYAVNAILVLNEIHTKSHSATKSQFSVHFIKTGKLNKKYGKLLSQLFDWRQRGDYGNVFEYEEKDVMPLFEQVNEMISEIEKEIKLS
ncbi:HEPN domain-containing protein [Marivirga tractuosa]|uniref:HEPN domain-containing protein n=1 Tax=Marivirga tractuosa TaxID=1006 RepID=UPI0035CF3E50